MAILAWGALAFGFLVIGLVAADLPRWRTNYDAIDYTMAVVIGGGGICTIATALRAIV